MKKIKMLSVPLILFSLGMAHHAVAVEVQSHDSQAIVGFWPGSGIQLPVDPNNPDPTLPVYPQNPDGSIPSSGGEGALTIDFASSFDFGNHQISNEDQTYFAKAQAYFNSDSLTPNYIQVTDKRGAFSGWTLKVLEESQFTQIASGPQKYKVLHGAEINLKNPETDSITNSHKPQAQEILRLVPGVESQLTVALAGEGAGTWVIRWGQQARLTKEGLTPDVSLFVPGTTPKDATAYVTTLNWILSDLPTNTSS